MAHEECPELTNNEVLNKAAYVNLEYGVKLCELIKDLSYSEAVALHKVCDLAKSNNCPANMYFAAADLKDALEKHIRWHKFNYAVHGIELT